MKTTRCSVFHSCRHYMLRVLGLEKRKGRLTEFSSSAAPKVAALHCMKKREHNSTIFTEMWCCCSLFECWRTLGCLAPMHTPLHHSARMFAVCQALVLYSKGTLPAHNSMLWQSFTVYHFVCVLDNAEHMQSWKGLGKINIFSNFKPASRRKNFSLCQFLHTKVNR